MKNIVVWLLFAALACACAGEQEMQDDDMEACPVKGLELKELIPSDSYSVVSKKTFGFENGLIKSYVASQEIENGNVFSHSIVTEVDYSDGGIMMSDDNDNVWTYITDGSGYAKSCHLEEGGGTVRSYSFSYTMDGDGRTLLAGITESVEDGEEYSSLELDYSVDGRIRVTQNVDGLSEIYIVEFDAVEAVGNDYGLPDLFLSELYPLSMHLVALYGGILGDAYGFLGTAMYPEFSPELQEHTTFEYSSDESGVLNGCKMITVNDGKEYVRNIDIKLTL